MIKYEARQHGHVAVATLRYAHGWVVRPSWTIRLGKVRLDSTKSCVVDPISEVRPKPLLKNKCFFSCLQ